MPEQREYPDQTYHPAAKVRLMVRLDEFGFKSEIVSKQAPKLPPQLLRGQKGFRAPLEVQPDTDAPDGVKRFKLVPKGDQKGTNKSNAPQKQDASRDGLTFPIGGIIPKEAQLGLNGIRQADTLTVMIRYLDLPIDPRCVRSCGIQFFLGSLNDAEFANGVVGRTRGNFAGSNVVNEAGEQLNVIPDTYLDEDGNQRTNLRFEGFVDKWEIEWDGNGEPMVRLECRDNTTLLIDQQAPPKLVVSAKTPIDKAIAQYMSNFPRFSGLTVEYRPGGVDIPVIGTSLAQTAFKPQLGPTPGGGDSLSVWDYFTDVCGAIGHTIRLENTNLIIQRTRTIVSAQFVGRPDDTFPLSDRRVGGRKPLVRHMIYGRNVSYMKFGRNYAYTIQNIEVRCYSDRRKKVLVARFPQANDKVLGVVVRPGDLADQKWTVVRVSGIEDPKNLRIIAQSYYENVNRNELTVNIRTKNLASFGGGELDPDLLDMRSADTVDVQINRDADGFNSTTEIERDLQIQSRAVQYMRAIGYDGKFADAYAKAYTDAGFQTQYRVRAVGITWSVDPESSVELDIQAVNYIEVRGDRLLPPSDEQKRPAKSQKPQQEKV